MTTFTNQQIEFIRKLVFEAMAPLSANEIIDQAQTYMPDDEIDKVFKVFLGEDNLPSFVLGKMIARKTSV